jgi:hypothetical protein
VTNAAGITDFKPFDSTYNCPITYSAIVTYTSGGATAPVFWNLDAGVASPNLRFTLNPTSLSDTKTVSPYYEEYNLIIQGLVNGA